MGCDILTLILLERCMPSKQQKPLVAAGILILAAIWIGLSVKDRSTSVEVAPTPTTEPVLPQPVSIPIPNNALKQSIIDAGDYMVRQQLPNGELSYQVDFQSGARQYSPSSTRLMSGTGALYTVCRVSAKTKYCNAGDLALKKYLDLLVMDPQHFAGACLYTSGTCELGGSALTIDAIYKRWRASGSLELDGQNLKQVAVDLGKFILSMRKAEGGFYHAFDPYYGGTADPNYYSISAAGQSLLALTELYEMTGNPLWLTQAHEVNDFMITQPVTEDHWHGYALAMLARVDTLTEADSEYATVIAQTVVEGGVRSLNAKNSSIASATKIEALASLAQALFLSDEKHEWLDTDIQTFITFVRARQLPANNCDWTISDEMTERYGGGIFSSCDDPSIRVDGQQHYIDGITTYLEYQSMTADK
jgi:hypothetical protein